MFLSLYLLFQWEPVSKGVSKDVATLNCSVATYERCKMKVHFLFNGSGDQKTWPPRKSHYACEISQVFAVTGNKFKERLTSSWCIVKNNVEMHMFPFHPSTSGRNIVTITQSTSTPDTLPTGIKGNNFVTSNTGMRTQSATAPDNLPTDLTDWWWLFVTATVLLAAVCTLTFVTVRWCKRNKGGKAHPKDNVNKEDGVFYTSVNFTGIRKARVRNINDDSKYKAVTYSTVKASPTDPSNIYASMNPSS